ncbi:aldehyde dehydrogenase (NAD+) [Albimonas donghaensis]|uniref:Aldehyde dehydrogenase (NAD+) n=1 Tax=Albimonas donghaensis TaxID=356660 RepID=A0A1H3DTB7_9RHOB|nr:aldehyde dehydrogenase family protein [Albimonas donghaensis]SDX69587.1 aldehyde dehydrogenase (NAD+) [Albimonas donghaensis]
MSGCTSSPHLGESFIDGRWIAPVTPAPFEALNPATGRPYARFDLAGAAEADAAARAAAAAFPAWSATTRQDRIDALTRVATIYKRRMEEMAAAISTEMGAPARLALRAQAGAGYGHLKEAIRVLEDYMFEETMGTALVTHEPLGVCALITPWNWPMNQIACKVAPALAAGCTMILKPSELAPLSALLFAEILEEAELPAGVFNLVIGEGRTAGATLSAHPDVDMVSFTGSNRGGVAVALAAAPSVKRVHQELGGKSANVLLPDVDFDRAVPAAVRACMANSGQSCDAPTRLLVPADRLADVEALAAGAAESLKVGPPDAEGVFLGPLANRAQFDRVRMMIREAAEGGARLLCGGPDRPSDLPGSAAEGFYIRPTVFSGVTPDMALAREEVFGPVLAILAYGDEADALRLVHATRYGLSGYVSSADSSRALAFARRMRTGMVHINGAASDFAAPFGGWGASGNGEEWGRRGLEAYLIPRSLFGAT